VGRVAGHDGNCSRAFWPSPLVLQPQTFTPSPCPLSAALPFLTGGGLLSVFATGNAAATRRRWSPSETDYKRGCLDRETTVIRLELSVPPLRVILFPIAAFCRCDQSLSCYREPMTGAGDGNRTNFRSVGNGAALLWCNLGTIGKFFGEK
jgi:hypothetical protein